CRDRLITEVAAWEQLRNASGARINWMFSTETARKKLAKAYPVTTSDKPS
ncbi:IS630 family transposase, partial [Ralstonia solanacearum species complex bacterium KE055]